MTSRDRFRSIALSALAFAAHGALAQDGAAGQGAAASGQGEAAPAETSSDVTRRREQMDAHARATLDELFDEDANAETVRDAAAGYAVFAATKAGFFVTGGTRIRRRRRQADGRAHVHAHGHGRSRARRRRAALN